MSVKEKAEFGIRLWTKLNPYAFADDVVLIAENKEHLEVHSWGRRWRYGAKSYWIKNKLSSGKRRKEGYDQNKPLKVIEKTFQRTDLFW